MELNRSTFCSGAEVAPVQCTRGLELRKNELLFAKTNVIFEISESFSTICQTIVLALEFSFKRKFFGLALKLS